MAITDPDELDRAIADKKKYLGPHYNSLSSNLKWGLSEVLKKGGLDPDFFVFFHYFSDRLEAIKFVDWLNSTTMTLVESADQTALHRFQK